MKFRENRHEQKKSLYPYLYLLNIPTYFSVIGYSLTTDMNLDLWNKLYNSLYSLPEIID